LACPQAGGIIQLLGVLLFDVNPRAVKRNEEVFAQVNDMLEGSGTTPFDVTIRSAPAAAVDMLTLHKTAGELVALAHDERRSRLSKQLFLLGFRSGLSADGSGWRG
jgi:chromosome partitioning protein